MNSIHTIYNIPFYIYSYEQNRATSTLQELAKYIDNPLKKSCLGKAVEVISDPESCPIKCPAILEPPKLSDTLCRGKRLGCFMSRFFLLPVMPRIVGDIWFLVELLLALILFILSLINIQYTSNKVFISLTITTTAIMTILTCIDAVLYFYELRSCKLCYRFYKGQSMSHDVEKKVLCFCCPCIPTKLVKLFNRWYEIIRTILTECLMYPLLIVCLFELLNDGSFHYKGHNKITFSIFVIACFYIVMTIYIVRLMMATITVVRLQRLTSTTTNNSSYTRVFLVFLLHVLAQIFVHLLCVIAVGLKIWQEQSMNGETYNATPFLWVVMIGGWMIPFMGVISFFVMNYYWLQHFSLGFFIDMIGLLEEPDFAEAVFQGKGISYSGQEKSKSLLEDVCYQDVKKEAKIRNERTNFVAKIIYPLKVPLMMMFAVFYNFVMGGFIASLLLDYDERGNVTLITLDTGAGITTLVTIAFLVISNIHVILIINLWLVLITISSFLLMLSSPVLAVIGVVIIIKKCIHRT